MPGLSAVSCSFYCGVAVSQASLQAQPRRFREMRVHTVGRALLTALIPNNEQQMRIFHIRGCLTFICSRQH
ncbi:hypothetical protein BDV11DRAFT_191447 [Aspergillus similis]